MEQALLTLLDSTANDYVFTVIKPTATKLSILNIGFNHFLGTKRYFR